MVSWGSSGVTNPPTRLAQAVSDDTVLPFQVDRLDVRGRIVRLGPLLDHILTRHDYPKPVARLLAEASALAALLGSALKHEGRMVLQTKGDGPVSMLVVDFDAPDGLRACASFNPERVREAQANARLQPSELLGNGYLAMTLDQGADMKNRYQGIVELDGASLEEAASTYFLRSEQIPTVVRLGVAESVSSSGGVMRSAWRATGFLVQFLPESPERRRMADLPPGDAPSDFVAPVHRDDEAWLTARALVDTIGLDELVDPLLSPETLLYRLFNQQGVRVFEPQTLRDFCRCSQERIIGVLKSFSPEERTSLVKEGRIAATCEFCSRLYEFSAQAVVDEA